MEEATFRELFQGIVERYELAPEVAEELLQRILTILENEKNPEEALQSAEKSAILLQDKEREV